MKHYLKLMRIHHYMKNILVFGALICSGKLFELEKLLSGIAGFAAFCMICSVVYVINDIRDVEKDRNHPTKCKRPIAAGKVSVKSACILAVTLAIVAVLCNALVFNPWASVLPLLYLLINLSYSFGMKNIPLVDVTILASGFVLRVLYGALITSITISSWLYLTIFALAFYFALGKRRNELRQTGNKGETRKVLKAYPVEFLDKSMNMCLALANVFYALWSMDGKTAAFYHNDNLIFTVPIVLLITLKYSLDIEGESDGDPVEVLLHDKVLIALCGVYFVIMFLILYM